MQGRLGQLNGLLVRSPEGHLYRWALDSMNLATRTNLATRGRWDVVRPAEHMLQEDDIESRLRRDVFGKSWTQVRMQGVGALHQAKSSRTNKKSRWLRLARLSKAGGNVTSPLYRPHAGLWAAAK
jgi:hypothetical protein